MFSRKVKSIGLIVVLIFCVSTECLAKKNDPLNFSEKINYINIDFWNRFEDPFLVYYINEAVKQNHDAKKASWKVEEFRQNVKYSFGQELPSLSVGANYAGTHIPDTARLNLNNHAFILPFIARYEPDFLLKNRDKTRSIKKEYEATKYDEKSVYLSLVTDVATAYLNVLYYDDLIRLQEQLYSVRHERLERETKRFERGVINNQQLNSLKKELETAKNDLETMEKNRDTTLTQLALLVGESPNANYIRDLKRSTLDEFEYSTQIPDSIPSDLMFSRPDVIAAEARLQEAKINVRVARKEFLPTFNVLGTLTYSNIFPGSFFAWDDTIAFLLAGATQDIFTGGMKVANLKMNKARYEQLFEDYKQTDLRAVKEINDSLCIIKADTQTDKNTIVYLNLQKKDFKDNMSKYSRGVVSYPVLLSEQERLLQAQQNQAGTKTSRLIDYFTLYKAVGGQL